MLPGREPPPPVSRSIAILKGVATIPRLNRFPRLSSVQLSGSDSTVRAFWRIVGSARTVNQLNKVLIRFEERITPAEMVSIDYSVRRLIGGSLEPIQGLRWKLFFRLINASRRFQFLENADSPLVMLHRLWSWSHTVSKCTEEVSVEASNESGWVRAQAGTNFDLFRRTNQPSRRLIVGLSSGYRRMLIQTPIFLSAMADWESDFLLVTTPRGMNHLEGIQGRTDGFEESHSFFSEMYRDGGYEWLGFIGASLGGIPATVYASALSADYLATIGAEDPAREYAGLNNVAGYLAQKKFRGETFLAYGGEAEQDRRSALAIQGLIPHATLVEVPEVPHSVLWEALLQGTLAEIFRAIRPKG